MRSLKEHRVYQVQEGRVTDDDDPPVPDVISVGAQQLTAGSKSPLVEYNRAFKRLKRRRQMRPVTQEPSPELTFTDLPRADISPGPQTPPALSPGSSVDEPVLPTMTDLAAEIPELQEPDALSENVLTETVIENEMQEVLQELEEEEEATLRRESMRDVAHDMDEMTSDEEGDESDIGYSTDDD